MKYHLLTGGTGLLGRYLLRDLTLAEVPLAVVVRPSRGASAARRVETVMAHWEKELGRTLIRPVVLSGDLTQPGLGLDERDARWLKRHCDAAIHSAASLTFYADEDDGEPWRSNVGGTRNVLAICREAGIRQFHHVSTAYVCGRRRERILETELDVGQQLGNDYEQTKLAAEKEVLACGLFDQLTVHRPSIIVGDSQTGHTTSYHGFYTPLRLIHSIMTSLPWEVILQGDWLGGLQLQGHERKNLVPVDWVSAAMTWVIARPELHGRTYHLTNPNPATTAEMVEAIALVLGKLASERPAPPTGNLPPAEMIESFREQMKVYQSYWSDDPQFDSAHTQTAVPHLPCPEVNREVMDRLIRYAIDANFGWPREPLAEPREEVQRHLRRWLAAEYESPAHKHNGNGHVNGGPSFVNLGVSGGGGGQWHLIVERGRLVGAGTGLRDGGPVCYLNSDTFAHLARGGVSWERAVNTGRLIVAGNPPPGCELDRVFGDLVNLTE